MTRYNWSALKQAARVFVPQESAKDIRNLRFIALVPVVPFGTTFAAHLRRDHVHANDRRLLFSHKVVLGFIMKRYTPTLPALLIIAACSSPSDDNRAGSIDAGPSADSGPSNFSPTRGTVSIAQYPMEPGAYLSGYFNDAADLILRTETERIGSCRLMSYTPSLCEPACANFDLCVDGQCRSFPARLDKGQLEWSYPGGSQNIQPDSIQGYTAMATPSAQGVHTLVVDGETLQAETVPPLEAIGDWNDAIATRSGDVVLRWSNPVAGARVRLAMTDCTGSHGGVGDAEIECEASDTGELTLPATMLNELDKGNWSRGECGSHSFTRYRSDSAQGDAFRFETISPYSIFYFPGR